MMCSCSRQQLWLPTQLSWLNFSVDQDTHIIIIAIFSRSIAAVCRRLCLAPPIVDMLLMFYDIDHSERSVIVTTHVVLDDS